MAEPAPPALRVRDHAVLAAIVAGAWGVIEGQRIGTPRAVAVSAALLVLAGAGVGLVQAGVLAGVRALRRRAGAHGSAAPDDPERPHRTRATAVAATVIAAVGLAGLWLVTVRLQSLHDDDLAAALLLFVAAAATALGVFATPLLAGLLLAPLREFVRSVDWPFPERPAVRRFLFFAAPVGAAILLLQRQHARELKPHAFALGAPLLLVAEVGLLAVIDDGWLAWLRRRAGRLLAGLLLVALALVVTAPDDRKFHDSLGARTGVGGVQRIVRGLTDFDGDGASAWLGGGDCAGFDPARGPHALDEPGNRVDEDCDGVDAWPWERGGPQLERYHGHLEPGLVRDYNVVWIIVDAMRVNHLSAFGYRKPTTPYLEHLADESLVFHQAYSQSSATLLSIPSMIAGRPVGTMNFDRKQDTLRARIEDEPLAASLQRHGYRTGFVVDRYVTNRLPAALDGFETLETITPDNSTNPWRSRQAATAVTRAIEFLERDPEFLQPFFLTIYMADPHAPYVEHPGVRDFGRGGGARYDNELAYTDQFIGFFLEYLRSKPPLLDNTIFIVASDHGEEFNDHGGTLHARTCHEESVHVPLLVRIPGQPRRDVDVRVGLNDVVPTLVELLGLDVPADAVDGQSLLIPALAPQRVPADRPVFCTVLSQRNWQGDFLRHGVRVGRHALLQDVLERHVDLYDLAVDPREKHPLDPADPAVRAKIDELTRTLRDHLTGNIEYRLLTN